MIYLVKRPVALRYGHLRDRGMLTKAEWHRNRRSVVVEWANYGLVTKHCWAGCRHPSHPRLHTPVKQ